MADPVKVMLVASFIYGNIMKSGEMKHEMTLFYTMGPNRNDFVPDKLSFCDRTMVLSGDL